MLHAGIGPTHVNELLSSINVPSVGEFTLKAREREVGPKLKSWQRNHAWKVKKAKETCGKRRVKRKMSR